jgi:deazaflavin-dependent oxidoreductase (nitroreductase family)
MKGLNSYGLAPGSTYLLTTTGRKSGQQRTTPVTLVVRGDRRWLVSPYGEVGWVRNLRAGSKAKLSKGRAAENVALHEVPPADAGPVLKTYLERYPIVSPFFEVNRGDPVERFVAEAAAHPVFEVLPV